MEEQPGTEIEKGRLLELYHMNLLSQEPDAVLDGFCEKVARLFNVPTCVVSLVLEDRQWFKSSFGCPAELSHVRETPREISFCTHVVENRRPLIVKAVNKDPRFAHNPLVKKYGFGFYAGFPLTTSKGHVIGSLCLYDHKPREFSHLDIELLGLFSERVMAHLELCRELQNVRASEARLRSIAESAHDGLIVMGEDERILDLNQAAARMFGWSREELIGQSVHIIMPDRYRQRHQASMRQFIERGASDRFGRPREFEGLRRDGTEIPIEVSISGFKGGTNWTFTAFIRDISDRKRTEGLLRKRDEQVLRYHKVLLQLGKTESEDLGSALRVFTEVDSKTLEVERVSVWFFSQDRSELVCENLYRLSEGNHEKGMRLQSERYPRYFEALESNRVIAACDACTDPQTREFCEDYLKPHGITSMMDVPVWLHGKMVGVVCHEHTGAKREWTLEEQDFAASIADMVALSLEASHRRQAQQVLEEQAIRDSLTNLYNRRYFYHRIEEEIARADRSGHHLALLMCDLNHFKVINDTLGHHRGDEVLKEVADAVLHSIRTTDLGFRWGGDEFLILLYDTTQAGVLVVGERVRRSIQMICERIGRELDVSIGAAIYPEHGRTPENLIHLADRALYIAKRGIDKIQIGEEEYHLGNQTIQVVFQPVVDVRSGQAIGYEALSRDARGKLGIQDLFKKYHAIGRLFDLQELCFKSQIQAAREGGLKRVFINADLQMLSRLEPTVCPPGMEVILDLSEMEVLGNAQNHLKIVQEWREAGYRLAFDDFGAVSISLPFFMPLPNRPQM